MMDNTNNPQLNNRLDTIINRNTPNKVIGVGGYIFWGLLIPPFTTIWSMYSAYKKKVLHILVPTMMLVYSIFFALFSFSVIYSPKSFNDVSVAKFSEQLNIPSIPYWITASSIILTVAGIFGGWYFRRLAKKKGRLSTILMVALLLIIFLQFFVMYREFVFLNTVVKNSVDEIFLGL